jgi:PAS domain S-box-containing protein
MDKYEYEFLLGCELFSGQQDAFVKLYQILESSFDGIYITDKNANTIFINHSYEIITGLNRADMLGKNMQALIDAKIIDKSGSLKVLKTREPVTLEQKFSTGKHAIITSTPSFDENGNITMIVTNVRDVTELYSLKEKLAREEEVSKKKLLELEYLQKSFSVPGSSYITNDLVMLKDLLHASKVAKKDTIVLLLGETGVGKEVFANYIHRNSPRAKELFIKINCGSIVEELVESELFGYERGAFTGANSDGKPGLFEVAKGGTIFLDEIGELSLDMQVKFLRVIQEKEIMRVGGTKSQKVDVRIIAATNRDLNDMVAKKLFREDLLYRINVFPIVIPPLRERPNDILPLARSILAEFNKEHGFKNYFSSDAEFALINYRWPGNIRELRNVIERAVILSGEDEILSDDLEISKPESQNIPHASAIKPIVLKDILEKIESDYINQAYEKHQSIRKAADFLSMDPATYLRKREKYKEVASHN